MTERQMWEIRKYDSGLKREWDEFVSRSRNATFLFLRDYMDYHADRFEDHSLMAYRRGKLCALLPANRAGDILNSHQGLTYGGWLLPRQGIDTNDYYGLWKRWLRYCTDSGIKEIIYKPLPTIYATMPSEEDRYLLFLCGAGNVVTNMASAINLRHNPGYNKLQRRHLAHTPESFTADNASAEAAEEFHSMLSSCLAERHESRPVHSACELKALAEKFPENIRFWIARDNGKAEGGVCVFITPECVHCQYIATTVRGRETDILAALFAEMIAYYTERGVAYFDFGTSNEDGGRLLNEGLNRQKTAYGGSGVAYSTYRINAACALKSLPSELWPPKK